jgi:hypothetical protein
MQLLCLFRLRLNKSCFLLHFCYSSP